MISLYVISLPKNPIILGHPWLYMILISLGHKVNSFNGQATVSKNASQPRSLCHVSQAALWVPTVKLSPRFSRNMLSLRRCWIKLKQLNFPLTVLGIVPSIIVAPIRLDIIEELQQEQQTDPPPPTCPPTKHYVPCSLRQCITQWVHTSLSTWHPGIQCTLLLLHNSFWWPNITQDVRNFVKSCSICAQSKIPW